MKTEELTKEQKFLLKVLSSFINGKRFVFDESEICGFKWGDFVKESVYQAVCFSVLENSKDFRQFIPEETYKKWKDYSIRVLRANANVLKNQNELIDILDGKYKYIILKGFAAASYYDSPSLRSFGDVDFLVEKDNAEEIKALLIENEYNCEGEDNDHHIVFKKSASHIEMHFEIPGIPYGEIGDKIRSFMQAAFSERVLYKINYDYINCEFYAPDKVRHGLILILHMQHHMLGEGLGLRHLSDWACYVKQTINEDFWETTLLPFLKEIGIFVYASAITKTCAVYLGIDCPMWCKNVSEELCKEIILDIFRLGNFGVKDVEKSRSGALISDHGKDGTKKGTSTHLLKQFKSSVKSRHKSLEKHKILYPIFYVYEFFRYTFDVVLGKKPKITKLLKDSEERKSVYEKLHVFETEKERK